MTCSSCFGAANSRPEPGTTAFALPILIVDSRPADLGIVADCLRAGGFGDVRAAVGSEAGITALAGDGALAVVLVDLDLVAPDGLELLSHIEAMDAEHRPLVLAMARDSAQPARISALTAGASDFLTRPFDGAELLLRVRNLAQTKRREYELERRSLAHQRRAAEYRALADDAAERAAAADGRFRLLADNCAEVVAHLKGTEVAWISKAAEEAFGWPVEQWIGTDMTHRFHPDDLGALFAGLADIDQGRAVLQRMRIRTADGGYRWAEGYATPSRDDGGDVEGVEEGLVVSLRVVEEPGSAERQRAEAETRYQMLFEASPDALIIVGADGRIELANGQAERTFGYPHGELLGTEVEMLVPERFRGKHDAKRMGFVADPLTRPMGAGLDLWGLRRDGTEFPVEISLSPVRIGSSSTVLAAIRDVTEQRAAKRLIQVVKQRFESVVQHSPSAISVSDLQHRYTMVNNAFCELFDQPSAEAVVGKTGLEILPMEAWERKKATLPQILAGDHYLEEEAIHRGSGKTWVVTERFALRDAAGVINEVVTIRTDITHRRAALLEIAERSRWEERVSAPAGQLLVYSQPIVDIATRTLLDEELLVRLRIADTDEILPPGQFLPECERYQLMPAVDRHMVGRAIELARSGRSVSVNITSQTISDAVVMEEILGSLIAAGRDVTERIMFEITETTASAAPEIAKDFSLSIRNLGCRVALDDFGTGYGTFTELRHLHLHALKIDRSFVSNMLEDPDDERVVTTIISVAKAYGLATIAEGVESEAVLDRLSALGVDRAQGYLFGRPKFVLG